MSNETERRHNEIFWASPNRVGQGIATYADLDQSIFEGLETREDVAGDQLAMDSLAASETAMDAVAASETAMDAVAASETAMDSVAVSETAMDSVAASATARGAIVDSDIALDAVAGVNMAIGKFAVGVAGLDPTDFADMDAVAASETAMDAVAASQTAMDAVAASETAMDAVVASQTAMDSVAVSETAMDSVAVSETAMDSVAASATARGAIVDSDIALDAVAGVNMAIGKFAVALAGLDPTDFADMDEVAASKSAMDAVAASESAMEAVGSSVLAVTATFAGTASDSLWSSASVDTMRAFLENAGGLNSSGDVGLPHTVSGTDDFVYDADEIDGLYGLDAQVFYDDEPSDRSTDRTWAIRFDASNFDNIKLEHKAVGDFRRDAVIEIDGSEVFSTGSDSPLQERSFDISGISGEVDIAIGVENRWFETDDLTEIFATRLRLE